MAAIDLATGLATAWNPDANNVVYKIVANGGNIYAVGGFNIIGGQPRGRIAALDASTGLATSWDPNADNYINTIEINGGILYAGGGFTNIGGQTRNRIAAIDLVSGLATAWNPDANNAIRAIAISGNTIYAGGDFTNIGGSTRSRLAAIDATTGLVTSWDPNANSSVSSIGVNGSTIYAGGPFTIAGASTRNRFAAIDATTGIATSWNPSMNSTVNTLLVSGSNIYIGGLFSTIGTEARSALAAFINSTLPVRLLSFSGTLKNIGGNEQVALDWSTTQEENSSHFILEKNTDGRTFRTLAQVASTGNATTHVNTYSYMDNALPAGTSWYRLKQVDLDGQYKYSPVVAVSKKQAGKFSLYPNPVMNTTSLNITSPKKDVITYTISDQAGRITNTKTINVVKGNNAVAIDAAGLSKGIYTIIVKGTYINGQVKLVK